MNRMDNFLKELKSLLAKYNATIDVGYDGCSDTYGIYGEHMDIYITKESSFKVEESHKIEGWGLDSGDIKLTETTEPTNK